MNASTYTISRIASGEYELVTTPRGGGVGRPLVVVAHGAGGTPSTYMNPSTSPGIYRILHTLMETYATITTDFGGGHTWGNDTVLTRFDSILSWAASNLPGVTTSSVYIWGSSMGNWTALRCAADRSSQVRAVVANVPVCDINDIRNRNALGARANIDAAWGVTYPTALPSNADLLTRAQGGALAGLPWKAFSSSGDTVCPPSTVTAMVSAIGATASNVVVSSAEHGDAPIAAANPQDVVDFFESW